MEGETDPEPETSVAVIEDGDEENSKDVPQPTDGGPKGFIFEDDLKNVDDKKEEASTGNNE